MKSLRVLIFLAILMTACAGTEKFINPLCVNEAPLIQDMSVEDQLAIWEYSVELLLQIADNQLLLIDHILLVEKLIAIHNTQFEAECW